MGDLPQAQHPAGVTRHTRWARISHWIVTVSFLTLVFSGFVILMAHPRLYWGEVGNDLTPALFELPVSRNYQHGRWEKSVPLFADSDSPVSAIRTYEIFNENGWEEACIFWRPGFSLGPALFIFSPGLAAAISGAVSCPVPASSLQACSGGT